MPVARPYPAVHKGGISAVAIATPEKTVPFSFLHCSNIPAKPPNRAIMTSKIVGLVLARSSVGLLRFRGVIRKYRSDTTILIETMMRRFLPACFIRLISLMPRPSPRPNIGPIKGEMSMAPIMTGMELIFRPTDAMMIATARIHALGPRNSILPLMALSAASVSICVSMFIISRITLVNF